jgi:hypothetical protein
MLALSPSPSEGEGRKRRWPGESAEQELSLGVAPKRRYVEAQAARRQLNVVDAWVAHLRTRYPAMSDKARTKPAFCRSKRAGLLLLASSPHAFRA